MTETADIVILPSMDITTFAIGVLTLLTVPGPTNTLLAASGAARGGRASAPLLGAEISGYLISISTQLLLLGPILAALALGLFAVTLGAQAATLLVASPTMTDTKR